MPRRGGKRKKTKTHVPMSEQDIDAVPKSVVLKRSSLSIDMKLLEAEIRAMMGPYTAMNLKESTKVTLKDINNTASNFGAKNLVFLSEKENRNYLRFALSPKGPTFTFQIKAFSLEKDFVKTEKVKSAGLVGLGAPFCMISGLENFGNRKVSELLGNMLGGLFPKRSLLDRKNVKRVVVFHYNEEQEQLEIRNYTILKSQTGVFSQISDLLKGKDFDFSKFNDAGELFASAAPVNEEQTDSEMKVKLSLNEVGPRISLKLLKVEEGLMSGEVLYHALVQKSDAEREALRIKAAEKAETKRRNRETQENNVRRKEEEKEEKRKAKEAKYKAKKAKAEGKELSEDENEDAESEEDQADYFEGEGSDTENQKIIEQKAPVPILKKRVKSKTSSS